MRKFAIILILIGITDIVSAQSPVDSICKDIQVKLEQYDSDSITVEVKKILDLFEQGDVFDQDIVEQKYIGLVYILSDEADCASASCTDPVILPAVWFGSDMGICMMGIRARGGSDSKRPLSNYVQAYLKRMPVSNEAVTMYIAKTNFRNGLSSYYKEDNSFVIDDDGTTNYARKNGDYIIGLTISKDRSNVMIYVFDVAGQEQLLSHDTTEQTATPQSAQYSVQTKKKIEELSTEEKSRNEFSEMIEVIVNDTELSSYYHNRDMFILSSGLFRDDLEVKYKNKNMLIVAMPLDGITDYIEFTRHTYDGETDHPVLFEFHIQKEGSYGSATFNYKNGKWTLDSMNIIEN